jgi:hypothetical protein
VLVLDARYIDQADNTAVSTWADRSASGYDFSQATGANQPTLQTGEVGGSSIVRFDGSNDKLIRSDTGFPTGNVTLIMLCKQNNTMANNEFRTAFGYGQAVLTGGMWFGYGEDINYGTEALGVSQYGNALGISSSTQVHLVGSFTRNSTTYAVWKNGGSKATKTMTTATATYGANGAAVGANGLGATNAGYPAYLNGDIGTIIYAGSEWSDSLRRKFESAEAYSWKIACS